MPEKIDYIIHEGMLARQERTIRRLWMLCIIIFVALIATNGAWLYYETQFADEVITQEIEQDAEGGNNTYNGIITGGDYIGETEG